MSFLREETNLDADFSRPFWTFAFHEVTAFHTDNPPNGRTFHEVHIIEHGLS